MWRPAQRLRFTASAGRVPTAAEAAASRLFSPVRVGPVSLDQRTWVPAMVPWRATEDGYVTEDVIGWYERFAQGMPGAIVVEATGIRDVPSGPLLRIGHDRFLPSLTRLVETVRRASEGRTRTSSSSSSIFSPSAAEPEVEEILPNGFLSSPTGIAPRCPALDADIRSRLAGYERRRASRCANRA